MRPRGVTIIAIVAIAGGVAQVAFAGLPLVAGVPGVVSLLVAVAMLVLAGAQIAFGISALRLAGWTWALGVIASGLNAILNVVAMLANNSIGNYVGLFVSGAVLFYLTTPDVRASFGK